MARQAEEHVVLQCRTWFAGRQCPICLKEQLLSNWLFIFAWHAAVAIYISCARQRHWVPTRLCRLMEEGNGWTYRLHEYFGASDERDLGTESRACKRFDAGIQGSRDAQGGRQHWCHVLHENLRKRVCEWTYRLGASRVRGNVGVRGLFCPFFAELVVHTCSL